MTTIAGAIRQARIQVRIELFTWTALTWMIWPAIAFAVLFFLRDSAVMDSAVSLAELGTPGVVAMYLVTGGLMGISGGLMQEREDGTLLRAKAVPGAMSAHLLAGIVTYGAVSLVPVLLMIAAARVLIADVAPATLGQWVMLLGFCVLGLVATMPAGAVLGAAVRGPMAFSLIALVVYASMAISGIFYPLAALPTWLQWVGQTLPTYWLGVGLRAAILPPEAATLELHGVFATGTAALVFLAWGAVGTAFAPRALRRMVRGQSGSTVAAARDRVLSQGY